MPRENTEKLLDLISDGVVDETLLVRDLLNFLDDYEVGEFMEQYGYELEDEEEYPQDEIDEEEQHEADKELEEWRDEHGLDPLADFVDCEDT